MNEHLPRFIVAAGAAVGDRIELAADEAKHARVRRLRAGDAVALFDGRGRSYVGAIESLAGAGVTVRISAERPPREGESPLALTLAIGLLKTDRFEWLIEKATELGASAIQPFTSAHTLAQPGTARRARWQQIVLAAAKQCGRSVAPGLAEPVGFAALLAA
ncbi:MAG: RsmE family RNA methyltransferase, partial [Candidatus Binatia bacterium]